MLRTERADYRRSREGDLLAGLRARDPLALAEAYHRTSPAAHACARRLLGNARAVEALLCVVYQELWTSPPEIARLEGWVRSRCFRLGTDHLRELGEPPASPSLVLLLPDLPAPSDPPRDPAEQALAALPEPERRAVLLAHDQGLPTAAQDDPEAGAALDRALVTLAGPGEGVDDGSAERCTDVAGMADWTLGLLEADRAARVTAEVVDRPPCAARSRALRRGRRRLEGLPAAPDLGQRVLAIVLGSSPTTSGPATAAPAAATRPPAAPAAQEQTAGAGSDVAAPTSSLGDSPPSPITAAPLPSALDEEPVRDPATDPTAESPARDEPDGAAAPDETDDADDTPPAGLTDIGEATRQLLADHHEADDETRRLAVEDDDEAETVALRADGVAGDADAPAADTQEGADEDADEGDIDEDDADLRPASAGAPARGPSWGRRLLNVLAIIVVLAAGAGLGLLIGFLLVGGR